MKNTATNRDVLFSIITSCFNSTASLRKTYKSLEMQSYRKFEWILVDDASTDDGETRKLIEHIESTASFKVKKCLLSQNHFGAKSTFVACDVADGSYIAILDHDDQLTPTCLEYVNHAIKKYDPESKLAGVIGRCINTDGVLIGAQFERSPVVANEAVIRFNQKITAELFQFTKKEVAMPLFKLMKPGYTNGFVWAIISKNHSYLFTNEVFRIYDTEIPTSYSKTPKHLVRYPAAKAEALSLIISAYRPHLKHNLRYSSQLIASYLRHRINEGKQLQDAIQGFDLPLKMWSALMYPVAYLKAKQIIK